MTSPFRGVVVPPEAPPNIKRRYSVTGDVVGFRRCGRQYGAFRVNKYAPAYQTQLYFGTIMHQVLDRCHAHYHGVLDPATRGQIPDNGAIISEVDIQNYFSDVVDARRGGGVAPVPPSDLVSYFVEVENGLKSKGIWAVTPDLRIKAVRLLQYFNRLEGPTLYPLVKDTEHRLQADRGNHILHGVVDLLLAAPGSAGEPGECEIWDYKGTSRTTLTERDLETYQFQMRVYAHLYEVKHGVQPRKVILYFLNELDGGTCPTVRPVNAVLEVSLDPADIAAAVAEFSRTVGDIEAARLAGRWDPAATGQISEQDCAICDLRWDCPTPNGGRGAALRYP